jgi:hypothetical protein
MQDCLREEQHAYIRQSLLQAFEWTRLTETLRDHYSGFDHRQIPDKSKAISLTGTWLERSVHQQDTALKFSRQLDLLLLTAREEGYHQLLERIQSASTWFIRSLEEDQLQPLEQHIEEVKVQKKIKKYLTELRELKTILTRKKLQLEDALQTVKGLEKGLDASQLLSGLEDARKSRETQPAEEPTPAPASGRTPKGETHRISLHLYKAGIPIAEIAARRKLTVSTVEGHLASFIPTGEIAITELVPRHKIEAIQTALRELGDTTLNTIKARLGENYSFGEIRAVLGSLRS